MAYVQGYQVIIVEWILFVLALPFVGIRLYVQFAFRSHNWREIFTVLALLMFLAQIISDTVCLHNGAFKEDFDLTADTPETVNVLKMYIISMTCFTTCVYCCKFAMLCFYNDLAPRDAFPKTYWLVAATWVLNIGGCLYPIFYEFTICKPFSKLWQPTADGYCWSNEWYFVSSWVIHFFTEALVYGIPFIILLNLKNVSKSQKKAAYWMFAAGLLNVFMCIALGVFNIMPSDANINWALEIAAYEVISPLWLGTAIMIICLPQMRRFFKGVSVNVYTDRSSTYSRSTYTGTYSGTGDSSRASRSTRSSGKRSSRSHHRDGRSEKSRASTRASASRTTRTSITTADWGNIDPEAQRESVRFCLKQGRLERV